MSIISASRRTDVPAFYTDWFMNRLREGSAKYPNPFNGKLHEVSLRPEDVDGIVFWSRDYAPLIPRLPELTDRGYRFYAHNLHKFYNCDWPIDEMLRMPAPALANRNFESENRAPCG